jgi:hypothetical protein
VYVDQALLPELVAQRSQPPLTPYRRRTTIWRQSGGGPCTFAGHPPPSGRWHDSEGPPARRATTWRVLTGRLVAVSWDRPGRSGQQHASGPVSRMSRVDLRVSPGVARRAAAGAPKTRGRHWCRASGAAGAALIKYGSIRQRKADAPSDSDAWSAFWTGAASCPRSQVAVRIAVVVHPGGQCLRGVQPYDRLLRSSLHGRPRPACSQVRGGSRRL